jgi:hypothetical protein
VINHPPGEPGRPRRPGRDEIPADLDPRVEDDPTLHRAVATLRRLPEAPPGAVDRVVAAALVRNGIPGRRPAATTWMARAAVALLAAGLGASVALYGADRLRPDSAVVADARRSAESAPLPSADAGATEGATSAARGDDPIAPAGIGLPAADAPEDTPVATDFVLARPAAREVAVVGDFTGWKPLRMARDARGVWTASVPLPPGRHAYAFLVDDSAWVTDPRAPVSRDVDYGRDHSIVLVGRP